MSKIDQLISDYDEFVNSKPWYGSGLKKTSDEIPFAAVNYRNEGMSHSIGELVVHMINWRNFTIQKIRGNEDYDIIDDSDLDWMSLDNISEAHWLTLMDIMNQSYNELIELIGQKSDDWLESTVPGKKITFDYLARGILQHDIYHLGQIRYVLSMWNRANSKTKD